MQRIKPGMRVLEYGGGGSTIFFLDQGCRLTTVEHNPAWAKAIKQRVGELGENAAARLVLRVIDTRKNDEASMHAYVEPVRSGEPWDIILIDGGFRLACLEAAREHVSPGGVLIFDNTDMPVHAAAFEKAGGLESLRFSGLGFGRIGPTETTIFFPRR